MSPRRSVPSRRPPLHGVWLASLLLLAAACSERLAPEKAALERGRQRWAEQAIADYRFRFREFCFCAPETLRPVLIEVRGGEVASATYEDDGTAVGSPRLEQLPSVDGLFATIEDAIRREAHSLVVSYDATLGYPVEAQIDYIELAVDEEYGFEAGDLTPVEAP